MISTDPKVLADLGKAIYERRYKAAFEHDHAGKFAAIDLNDESATVGETASSCLIDARNAKPDGFFHLIRVGHAVTFDVGMSYRHGFPTRIHR